MRKRGRCCRPVSVRLSVCHVGYPSVIKYSSIFNKLRNMLPSSCLGSIYFVLANPHILYGIEIHTNTRPTYLKPLNVLQNQCLQTPVAHLYWEHQTLPIAQLHILQILSLVHNFLHHSNELSEVYKDIFIVNNTVHSYCNKAYKSSAYQFL